ncbi:MAG: AtpZ/AtpI family protein [Oscillospiraceae bacterium]|nr:AtpZ/AtpI family protein [Oscillospiraceae bacterium]
MSDFHKNSYNLAKGLTAFTQIGISTVVPIVFFIWGASWLQNKFGLGNWILLFGILLGVASGMLTFYKEATAFMKERPSASNKDK